MDKHFLFQNAHRNSVSTLSHPHIPTTNAAAASAA
jgi:hypothetical protein